MTQNDKTSTSQYTCNEYREEMILLALRRKLQRHELTEEERAKLIKEIARLEEAIGF